MPTDFLSDISTDLDEGHTTTAGFLLYGCTGFVGEYIARLAVEGGLRPVLAGRNAVKVETLAAELGLEYRVFHLDDPTALDNALQGMVTVLHCAGPYIHTSRQMVEGCLRMGVHYLDLTGEIPVLETLSGRDAEARARQVMILPAIGFDVAPTDCLALHLKQRLPTATWLTLAIQNKGPANHLPPGTANTMLEMLPYGAKLRRDGQLVPFPQETKTRLIDFGRGPVEASLFPWADVFTAFFSTRIPNIEVYLVMSAENRQQYASINKILPLLRLKPVRRFVRSKIKVGSTPGQRAETTTCVWGEVLDNQGGRAVSRLHGPEAGVNWTGLLALAAVRRVLEGDAPPGFQTPALAYGADFILECEGVTREDLD